MLCNFFTPRHFLFKLSLHVGVFTICSMGIMLYTISFFINMFGRDPEIHDNHTLIHWCIVILFIIAGFSIYVLGMVAAYKQSPRCSTITAICLVIHCIIWTVLTGLSFINSMAVTRIVCIDNRCADRLFIKNGNWRLADEQFCNNPSKLRGALLGDIDIAAEEGAGSKPREPETDEPEGGNVAFVDYLYEHGQGSRVAPSDLEKHRNLHARSVQRQNLKNQNADIDSRRKRNVPGLYNSSALKRHRAYRILPGRALMPAIRVKTFNESKEGRLDATNANHQIRTPIGLVGCYAPHHIAFSVVCALMILCLWYIYPIIVFYAYARRIKRRLSQRGS